MTPWQWIFGAGLMGAALAAALVGFDGPLLGLVLIAITLVIGGVFIGEGRERAEAAAWSLGTSALAFHISARIASDRPGWALAAVVCLVGAVGLARVDPDERTAVGIQRAVGIVGLVFAVGLIQTL